MTVSVAVISDTEASSLSSPEPELYVFLYADAAAYRIGGGCGSQSVGGHILLSVCEEENVYMLTRHNYCKRLGKGNSGIFCQIYTNIFNKDLSSLNVL